MKTKTGKVKKRYIIIGAIVALFVIIYFTLPVFILRHINKVLTEMDGYRGHVDEFHLNLIQCGFKVNGFKIERLEGKIPVPFFYADEIGTHLEWGSLLHGKILGEMKLLSPKVNFVKGPTKATTQTGTEGDWTTAVKKLKSFTINKVTVENGKISYYDLYSTPKVEIFIADMYMVVTNLRNVVDKSKKLPSHLFLTGNSIGEGKLEINANLNILKKIPDADVNFKFTKVHLTALNSLTKAYAKFDFDAGEFSLYAEAAVYDSHMKGYAKPLLEGIKVLDWEKDKDEGFFQKIWEGLVGTTFHATANFPKNRFATKIPFEGDIKDVKVKIFPTVINIFRNEFIKAFPKSLDNSININSAEKGSKKKK